MNIEQEINWLLQEKYQGEKTDAFLEDVEKLKDGTPLAFIIGFVPFLNTKISLTSRPLIPRTETEFWVEKVIEEIKSLNRSDDKPIKILDLCAGSGCIGIAIAKAIPESQVDFIEVDMAHLPTITKNAQLNEIDLDRTRILSGDLFDLAFSDKLATYDFIVSNPPYIDPMLDRTESSVKNHEPKLALYGGDHGLELIKRIVKEAGDFLNPGGQLWIEHEPEQTDDIADLAKEKFDCSTQKDQYGLDRFSKLVLQ